jgi:drug/metabolite transporter (DMT)-like permease
LNNRLINWFIFIFISFIWGSSFILMKEGLRNLSAAQVASIRIVVSGIFLSPVALSSFRQIPRNKIFLVFLSGVLGSLLPAYLYCIAEQKVESALAGTLNSLTPVFVLITGAVFFGSKTSGKKITGIVLAFTGSVLLFLSQSDFTGESNLPYLLLIILATLCYGFNVHLVHRYLTGIAPLKIVSAALLMCSVPASLVLLMTGFSQIDFMRQGVMISIGYSCLLGVAGTALASIFFYILIKRAGAVFSSMVTYGIPFVAIMWGVVMGEDFGGSQAACMMVILLGVFIANSRDNRQ